jgi:hypothetical protein
VVQVLFSTLAKQAVIARRKLVDNAAEIPIACETRPSFTNHLVFSLQEAYQDAKISLTLQKTAPFSQNDAYAIQSLCYK